MALLIVILGFILIYLGFTNRVSKVADLVFGQVQQ